MMQCFLALVSVFHVDSRTSRGSKRPQ